MTEFNISTPQHFLKQSIYCYLTFLTLTMYNRVINFKLLLSNMSKNCKELDNKMNVKNKVFLI